MGGQKTLPDLTGRFLQGSETAGNVVKAGMPNITGSLPFFTYLNPGETINNGALSGTYINASNPITGESTLLTFYNSRLDFNASKSNSIYGNANTVQPPAYTVKYYICGA